MQVGHESRRRPTDSEPVPIHQPVGLGVRGLATGVGRVRAEATGGQHAEPETDAGGLGGLLGPRHPPHQHPFPKGQTHPRLRQGLARQDRIQGLPGRSGSRRFTIPPISSI